MATIIPETVFQSEINECGLACIAMLAETQGKDITLQMLRERYPASAHGTSLDRLSTILSDLAIPNYPVMFSHEELKALPLPAILHYGAGHYVVLVYRKGNHVCVINPAIGQQILTFDALKTQISGYALVLDEEKIQKDVTTDKVKNKNSFWSMLSLKETGKIKGIYVLAALLFLISLTLFIMPTMVSQAINNVYSSSSQKDFPYVLFLGVFVISTSLALIATIITERFVKRFVIVNSAEGFSRLLNNSLRFFERRASGDVFSRFSAWQSAAATKIELDNGLRTDWIIAVIAFCVMSYMSVSLALISFIGVVSMGFISVWALYRDRWFTQDVQEKTAEQNEMILETIRGFTTVKTAGLVEQRKRMFAGLTSSLFSCYQKKQVYEQVKNSIYQLVGSLEMVFFMLVALPLLKNGQLSLGDFFAYSFIRQIFTSYITKIFYAVLHKNQLQVIDERARDLFPVAGNVPEQQALPVQNFANQLNYQDIAFSYDSENITLHPMSFSLSNGEMLAIAGESGSGKSTLLKVMSGLFPAHEGIIKLDEQVVNPHGLYNLFYVHSQEDILFNGTVRENITLFGEAGSDDEINTLLAGLELCDVITQLPGSLNAMIREDQSGLSLGQRQRLLLARSMYSKRPILLLDEPTANLDEATSQQVIASVVQHCRAHSKTLVVVTHNENVLSMFDSVMRLESGRLLSVELAKHQSGRLSA